MLGALGRVQQALGICVDKFGEVDTTSDHVEEWTQYQVVCDLGYSIGRVRLALNLGKLVKLIWTLSGYEVLSCARQGENFSLLRLCVTSSLIMVGMEPSFPSVRVFMIEEETLWYEFEHVNSQQGSSSKGNLWADVLSARALSQAGAGPNGRLAKMVNFEQTEVVHSKEPVYVVAEISLGNEGFEPYVELQPNEGMLLNTPSPALGPSK